MYWMGKQWPDASRQEWKAAYRWAMAGNGRHWLEWIDSEG